MGVLQNKIDFLGIIVAEGCNPNGDPLNGNRPRTDFDGYGEMSQECIKRKIRNQLQAMGEEIFVQTDEQRYDGYTSLSGRFQGFKDGYGGDDLYDGVCRKWFDVRAFGGVFAYKRTKTDDASRSVRGPVSVTYAKSLEPVEIEDIMITKSTNGEEKEGRASDTVGRRCAITKGVYVFKGGISPQLASRTGFSAEDAVKLKQAIQGMFESDASSARPNGSMALAELYWWEHPGQVGRYSPMRVFQSVDIRPEKDFPYYTASASSLPDLEPEIYHGI